ncbi:MAG: hypothetical protein ACTHJK_01190 [Sphingomicrobium sp.]
MFSTNPMNVEQFGGDAGRVRKFLRDMSTHYRQQFTTPEAMQALDLGEPEGTRTLVAMAEAGWLVYLGEDDDGFDQWRVGRLGIQYSMKKLLKRMPVDKAEALLDRTLAAVRGFNGTNASTRIIEVALFGSLARGGDEQKTVGDIDLQVKIGPREDASKEQRSKLLDAEMRQAPKSSTTEFEKQFWAERAGIRHLRAISTRLTVSTHDNIADMGCEYVVIYRFDPISGQELPCDRRLEPGHPEKQMRFNGHAEHEAPLPSVPAFRTWPDVPARKPTGLHARNQVNRSIAQYIWQRGYTLKDIARRQHAKRIDVQAVLAQCGMILPDPASIVITDSPVDALAPLLADFPDVHADIRLGGFGGGGIANVHLRRGRHHAMCASSPTRSEPDGDPELVPLANIIATAAALWHKRFRSKASKIELSMDFQLRGYLPSFAAEASTMKSATVCGQTFNQLFDDLYGKTEFEPLNDRKLRSVRLSLDLLALKLYRSHLGESKHGLPLGALAEPARELSKALTGDHARVISSIELSRQKSEWASDS